MLSVTRGEIYSGWFFVFLRRPLVNPNEKPDRYAAAICIRVRSDCLLLGYSVGESCRLSVLRRPQAPDLRRYPVAMRFSSNGYFFFFLVVFFAFAFFAFLAMLPSVVPKLAQCKSTIDMHALRVHHNCKIDTARFKKGKRRSRPRPDEALA
jgi:hypothetical protein